MKRTTYMMIGALIAGFVVVAAFAWASLTVTHDDSAAMDVSNADDRAEFELPLFSHLVIDGPDVRFCGLLLHDGVTVVERDSAVTPSVRMAVALKPVFRPELSGDTLILRFAPDADPRMMKRHDDSEGDWIATVIVPRGMLTTVLNKWNVVRLEGFDSNAMDIMGGWKLELKNCRIGKLNLGTADRLNKVFVDSTSVGSAEVCLTDRCGGLHIDCCDDSGVIGNMAFSGDENAKCYLDLEQANIESLEWNPLTPSASLTVTLSRPAGLNILKK